MFRIYNGTSVPFETMGERVNSSRDVVAHWTGMSGDVRQLQRFPMSGFQVTPPAATQHGGSDTKAFHAQRNDVFAGRVLFTSNLFLAKAK